MHTLNIKSLYKPNSNNHNNTRHNSLLINLLSLIRPNLETQYHINSQKQYNTNQFKNLKLIKLIRQNNNHIFL